MSESDGISEAMAAERPVMAEGANAIPAPSRPVAGTVDEIALAAIAAMYTPHLSSGFGSNAFGYDLVIPSSQQAVVARMCRQLQELHRMSPPQVKSWYDPRRAKTMVHIEGRLPAQIASRLADAMELPRGFDIVPARK